MTEIPERLRRSGLRATTCRIWIMEALTAAPEMRATVESLFKVLMHRGLRLSLSTIYTALRTMEGRRVVEREWDGEKIVYWVPHESAANALRFICRVCKREKLVQDHALYKALCQSALENEMAIGLHPLTIPMTCQCCENRRRDVH